MPKGRVGQTLDRSQSRGAQDGGFCSLPTPVRSNLRVRQLHQDDTDEFRTSEDGQMNEERRLQENEVEGELVRGDDYGENRLEANTNEEDGWALAEEHEDNPG